MTYCRIQNGVVDKVVNTSNPTFVFYFHSIFKTFSTWLRIDNLNPVPQLGWKYDKDKGFSEN